MPKTQSQTIAYHGWHIEIVQQERSFCFQCYPPQISEFCNDASVHASVEAAFAAACEFIDREIAILALIEQVDQWLEADYISEAEYWNLTNFA